MDRLRLEPSPETTLFILLGASAWPYSSQFVSSPAFASSATAVREFFLDREHGFGIPQANVLDLFDSEEGQEDIDLDIDNFLEQRIKTMTQSGRAARDLILYYIGHGGFVGDDSDYCLAIRRTRTSNLRTSAIQMDALATTLKLRARRLRRILIFDCCFSASAFKYFQGAGPAEVAKQKAVFAFHVAAVGTGYPSRGTALFCSCNHHVPSLLMPDHSGTIFSKGLLGALTRGHTALPTQLSLAMLGELTQDALSELGLDATPRPEVLSPDQSEGDVADVLLFPNAAHLASQQVVAKTPVLERQDPITHPTQFADTKVRARTTSKPHPKPAAKRQGEEQGRSNTAGAALQAGEQSARDAITEQAIPMPITPENLKWLRMVSATRHRARTDRYASAGSSDTTFDVALSHDGRLLATGSYGYVQVWQVTVNASTKALWRVDSDPDFFNATPGEHSPIIRSIRALAFSPDDTLLAVAAGNVVRLWDVATGTLKATLRHKHIEPVQCLAFSPNGQLLYTGWWGSTSTLWSTSEAIVLRTIKSGYKSYKRGKLVTHLASFSPNGEMIATASGYKSEVRLWQVQDGSLLNTLVWEDSQQHRSWLFGASEDNKVVTSLTFKPQGDTIIAGAGGKDTVVWDAVSGHVVKRMPQLDFPVMSGRAIFLPNPDIAMLVGKGSQNGNFRIVPPNYLSGFSGFSLSGNSDVSQKSLRRGSSDSEGLRLWHIPTGRVMHLLERQSRVTVKNPPVFVCAAAVSADGTTIAVGWSDSAIELWHTFSKGDAPV
jgi:WD40 repeat protein